MRLIDADALWMQIIHMFDYCEDILEIIDSAPTVDAEPVKRGKWISGEDTSGNYFYRRCTNCLEEIPSEVFCFKFDANYCPNCGAEMKGAEHELQGL